MKSGILFILLWGFAGCAGSLSDSYAFERRRERQEYRKAVCAAKADLRRGILAWEDIRCEEEEVTRILWCYRKLLAEKYGVEYRVISPSIFPANVGRSEGYKSVTGPIIAARLGADWEKRIFREAEVYYRANWRKVAHLCARERKEGKW